MEATLTKWGNSQGVRIPRDLCAALGVGIGAKAEMKALPDQSAIVITFEKSTPRFHRTKRLTATELFEGWTGGAYEPPADYDADGSEIDWGTPVGAEVIE